MGLELKAVAHLQPIGGPAQRGDVRVLLETDELILRGDVRARVRRSAVRDVRVRGESVVLNYGNGTLRLTLGDAARRFAARLAEPPRTRLEKMGIGAGTRVAVVNVLEPSFTAELRAARVSVTSRMTARNPVIVLGVHRPADIARIAAAARTLADTSALWVVHPKGVTGVMDTDIFAAAKLAGLTYTKVARFSDTHTAEKLVVPVASRTIVRKPRRVSG